MAYTSGPDSTANEIECPNCGERVQAYFTACPNCGLSFYPEDEDEPARFPVTRADTALQPAPPKPEHKTFSILALLAGWVASTAITYLGNNLAGRLFPVRVPGQALPLQALLFAAGPLGALAGGFLAARIAQERVAWHGLGVSILSLASIFLFEAYWRDLGSQPVGLATAASMALALGTGPLGALIWQRWQVSASGLASLPGPVDEKRLYYDLLSRVRHDIDAAERLIAYEARRRPKGSRAEWIASALYHLDRDNR